MCTARCQQRAPLHQSPRYNTRVSSLFRMGIHVGNNPSRTLHEQLDDKLELWNLSAASDNRPRAACHEYGTCQQTNATLYQNQFTHRAHQLSHSLPATDGLRRLLVAPVREAETAVVVAARREEARR